MTGAAAEPLETGKNVGVIFYRSGLTAGQRNELRRLLEFYRRGQGGPRVLHYGSCPDGDKAALKIVGGLAGWQVSAHPASETGIVGASRFLVAIGPPPEKNPDKSARATAWRSVIQAARAGRVTISYASGSVLDQAAPGRKQPGSTKAPRKQGGTIRKAPPKGGRSCRRCKDPVPASRERWGWLCEACERHPRPPYSYVGDERVPLGNSVYAVPAGLPSLGKRR